MTNYLLSAYIIYEETMRPNNKNNDWNGHDRFGYCYCVLYVFVIFYWFFYFPSFLIVYSYALESVVYLLCVLHF